MRKLAILLLTVLLLASCKKHSDSEIVINDNDFLVYEKTTQFEVNTYFLDLYLDHDSHSLTVTGRLVYLVTEDMSEVNLRIYPNEIASSQIDLEYLEIDGISKSIEIDSNNRSLFTLPLNDDVTAGQILNIDFSYSFDYWIGEGRITYYDDYYITMFFYPFVQLNNDDPISDYDYAFNGESYYNTIGDYYVSINSPRGLDIASSGKVEGNSGSARRKTIDYFLDNGRDFSFSAAEGYNTYQREINGIDFSIYSIRPLKVDEIEESFDTLAGAFEVYEEYIGPYPYDYFTLEYGNIYGMESTGIIYCSDGISYYTVVHEIVHQWLYSTIHNDQAREPFLDESLTTYVTFLYFYEEFGMEHASGYLDSRSSLKDGFEDYFEMFEGESLYEDIHEYQTGYGYIIYYHGPTLYRYYFEEILEDDFTLLKSFLKAYYDEYAFKEVSTIEMLDLLETITNTPGTKDWFLEEMESLGVPEPLN